MMKDLGVQPYLYPMPTYMIGTYNEDGSVDEMMMAWGGICAALSSNTRSRWSARWWSSRISPTACGFWAKS